MVRFVDPNELAAILRVSKKTLYSWTRAGLIPCHRLPSGRLRYDVDEVLEVLKRAEPKQGRVLAVKG
ncbi:MAG: helix-turn-helix domain-containing protein [Nitrososphaerota archaeon]